MVSGQKKAVVIDDEIRISDLVRMLLIRLGFQVECAADGKAGLELVEREKPDLLVTDMLLPKLHGLEVCKAVRENVTLSKTRIVAMTAIYKKLRFRLDARDVHVDAYLEKPFDIKEFIRVIQNLFPASVKSDEMEAHVEQLQERIEKQGKAFAGTLPEELDRINRLWHRYSLDQADPEDLTTLHQLVHRLTGAAAIFGHHEISRICRELEALLGEIKENGGAIIQSQQEIISDLLAALSKTELGHGGGDKGDSQEAPCPSPEFAKVCRNPEVPVTLISMFPHKLEELVNGIRCFGYRVRPVRFGELGRPGGAVDSERVVLDLRNPPSGGTAWMKKLDACAGKRLMNVVVIGAGEGVESFRDDSSVGGGKDCWKWVEQEPDPYRVIKALEDGSAGAFPEAPFRLLVVLKELALSEHFQILFRQDGFLTTSCEDAQLFETIREFSPDAVLLDLQHPLQNTVSQIRTVRAWKQDVPVLVRVSESGQDGARNLLEEGVADFIPDSSSFEFLSFSLKSHSRCWRRFRETREMCAGLHVWRYSPFMEAMETELRWAARAGKPMSVAVFGLDNVRELNRKIGEREVDRIAEALARLVQGNMQERDRIGHVGGAVYAGFFTTRDGQSLQKLLAVLQKRFSSLFFSTPGGKLHVSFSGGISRFPNLSDRNYLLEAALESMLRAQKSGGNRIISTF